MRTLSAGLTGHLTGTAHTRCMMMLIVLRNGETIGVTEHNKSLEYDLLGETVTYEAGTGITISDISLSAGLETDNCEVTGPLGDLVTKEAVLGGLFNRARAYLFQVNWRDLSAGEVAILAGNVAEARVEGGTFIFEVRGFKDLFNQVVGHVITNQCRHDFGDANCTAVPVSITGTVTAVTSPLQFTVSFAGTYAENYFNMGTCEPLAGVNAGGDRIEIFDWTSAGAVTLFMPLAVLPEIGDTFTIKNGCSKARISDDPTVPTCLTNNNVVNFGGFPEIPGSDQVLRPTIPGQGNDD